MYLNVFEYAAGASLSQSQKIAGSMQHHDSIRRPWMESYWASANPESDDGPGTESFSDHFGRARSVLRKFYGRTRTMTVFGRGQFMQVIRWCGFTGLSRIGAWCLYGGLLHAAVLAPLLTMVVGGWMEMFSCHGLRRAGA